MPRILFGSAAALVAALLATSTAVATPGATRAPGPPAPDTVPPPSPVITAITAGAAHTCALTAEGGVVCWGSNYFGELGDGSTGFSPVPVAVSGLASGTVAIAAGEYHTCALVRGGRVNCWGQNSSGQLGNGTMAGSSVPVAVSGLPAGVTAIAASGWHTCARTSGGSVLCWGSDYARGTETEWRSSLVPVDVTGLVGGFTTASGGNHACAVTAPGGATCWGFNKWGQLGNGVTDTVHRASSPVAVVGLARGVTAISAGIGHTCAIAEGGVVCWGYNVHGELGDRTRVNSNVPVQVVGLGRPVSAISAGSGHTCALASGGGVSCWGGNWSGQLGNGGRANSPAAVAVSGLASGIVAVAAGRDHTCGLTARGRVRCWGANYAGQLGDGTTVGRRDPVAIRFLVYPSIRLGSSIPAGTIDQGTTVTFSATVRPLAPAGGRPVVRFAVFRWEDGAWRTAAWRDVTVDETGTATLQWGFVTAGQRAVRARVLASASFVTSPSTPPLRYTVR